MTKVDSLTTNIWNQTHTHFRIDPKTIDSLIDSVFSFLFALVNSFFEKRKQINNDDKEIYAMLQFEPFGISEIIVSTNK